MKRFAGYVRVVSAAVCVAWLAAWQQAGVRAATGEGRRRVPFDLDARGLVVVPAVLGGNESCRCVLDTGSNRTVISDQLRAGLGLRPVARTEVVSSAGTATHDVVELPQVAVGEATREGLLATVLPADRMRAIADDAACVIGQDFLATRSYTIDYEAKVLAWESETSARGTHAARVPLVMVEGRYAIDLPQPAGPAASVRLVPDSGASAIVLFRQPDLPPLPLAGAPEFEGGVLIAANGERAVTAVRIERLRIGTIDLVDRPAFVVDRSPDERTGVQGLLPLQLFARVSVNAAEGMMVLTPR